MESGGEELTPSSATMLHHTLSSSSRPILGFPLGTALLLIVIFCISGVFSCCYHWDKLRSLSRSRAASSHHLPVHQEPIPSSPSNLTSNIKKLKEEKDESLPVIMPGDRIPTFMAWPCPCQQSIPNIRNITVEVMLMPPILPNHAPPLI